MKRSLLFLLLFLSARVFAQNPLLAPGNKPIDWAALNPKNIEEATSYAIKRSDSLINTITSLKVEDRKKTWFNVLKPLDDAIFILCKVQYPLDLMSNVHPDKAVRDKSTEAIVKISTYMDDINLNENLFRVVNSYATSPYVKLQPEQKYFLDKLMRDFKRGGMELSPQGKDSLKAWNKKMLDLTVAFNENITSDNPFLVLSEKEMEGLPEDFKKERKQPDGTYKVDMSYPSYYPFMTYAKSADARKKVYLCKVNIGAKKNPEVLKNLIWYRDKKAKLLGYKTYAEYAVEENMAKTTKNVWDFETKLAQDLRPKAEADYKEMLTYKSKETGKDETVLYPYDGFYYGNKILQEKYNVDAQKVKEYFETQNVIKGIFSIYQKLYNLSFNEVKNPSVWHKDVQAFSVTDNATKKTIGFFYLDLYPREDKYKHAACWPTQPSRKNFPENDLPHASLVCNFPKPSADQPSLLTHDVVKTFLHEFGHLIHNLLSETETASLCGTNVNWDFVEAPSQIMENWAWNKEVLSMFAKHYKTGETIPAELVDKMIAAKNLNSGVQALQQVFYGTLDFTLHDGWDPNGKETIADKVKATQDKVTLYPYLEGSHFECSFGHLTGYGAKYYGYLWSLVYAQDMFSVFDKTGVLSTETGAKFRGQVLSRGGSSDAIVYVRNFLGREPDNKAFLRSLGLAVK